MLHLLFTTLLGILSFARSAPVYEALSLPMNTASVNASSLGHHDRCDSSKTQSWQAYAFLVEDCFVAVNEFFIKHAVRNPDEIFEFSASQLRAHTRYPRVQTPVVFTHESCTLAIVMLDWFTLGQLPGESHFVYRPYDTSTSRGLWKAAKRVEIGCLEPPRRMPGWEPAGAQSSIGVFLWATDSDINRRLTGTPGFGLTNGSSTAADDSTAR